MKARSTPDSRADCTLRACLARRGSRNRNRGSETIMNEWMNPHIEETQAGMEVTSCLPAELDLA